MRHLTRIAALGALLMVQQLLVPFTGMAQVDPCEPVPIPGLCEADPSPSPPGDKKGGGGKGGGGGGGGGGSGGGGGGQHAPEVGDGGKGGKKGKNGQAPVDLGFNFNAGAPKSTARLVTICSKLGPFDVGLRECLLRSVGPFPIAGLSYWTNDWHACRDGCTRFHKGLDMFAKTGTPLVAMADGYVSQRFSSPLPGKSVEITDDDGVEYFYAHLSDWAEGLRIGQRVRMGDVIGYVGNTGNARYTPPHLHLEIQPNGVPSPPKPHVDRFLRVAERQALELLAEVSGRPLPDASDFRVTRLFDLAGGGEVSEAAAERFLALAGIQPSVSSLEMARRMLGEMAWEIDWGGRANAQLEALAAEYGGLAHELDPTTASPWAPFGSEPLNDHGVHGPAEAGD